MPISLLTDVIIELQKHAKTAGAIETPTLPTEGNIATAISQCYLRTANISSTPGPAEKDMVMFYMDVHFSRLDLPMDAQAVYNFYETFKGLLIKDQTLGGKVNTIQMTQGTTPINVEFGEMSLAGVKTLGLRWSITVKMQT